MDQAELRGVQRLSRRLHWRFAERPAAIDALAHDRMTGGREVNANLVRPAGLEPDADPGRATETFEHLPMRDRRLAALSGTGDPAASVRPVADEVVAEGAAGLREVSFEVPAGACVAVVDAFDWMVRTGRLAATPVRRRVAAVSVVRVMDPPCGIVPQQP